MAAHPAPVLPLAGLRHTVSMHHVRHMLLGAQARGLDTQAILLRAGIAPALRDAPLARITQDQLAALLRQLRHRLRDELWSLCRQPVPIGSFAQAARLAVHCATLGEALQTGLRLYRLLLSDFVPRLQRRGDTASVSVTTVPACAPASDALAYAQRAFVFFTHRLACWLVGRHLPLIVVDYPRLNHRTDEGRLLFQAPVRVGMGRLGWHVQASCLDLPVVQTPASLGIFLRQAPAGLIAKYRDQASTSERILRALRGQLGQQLPTLQALGRQLDIDPRTLRRRLADEGASFRALKDELRRDAAIEFLADPELSLPQIAQRLGFSEASTFHRAFKQWTGMAPGAYRHSRLAPAPPG